MEWLLFKTNINVRKISRFEDKKKKKSVSTGCSFFIKLNLFDVDTNVVPKPTLSEIAYSIAYCRLI